jgi:hypothetical protein
MNIYYIGYEAYGAEKDSIDKSYDKKAKIVYCYNNNYYFNCINVPYEILEIYPEDRSTDIIEKIINNNRSLATKITFSTIRFLDISKTTKTTIIRLMKIKSILK